MDEYLNFFDCYAPLLLRGIQLGTPEFTTVVGNLMRSIAWFLRPVGDVHTAEYAAELARHHQYILDYGVFIEEQGLPPSLLKISLHIMAC